MNTISFYCFIKADCQMFNTKYNNELVSTSFHSCVQFYQTVVNIQ